MNLDTQAFETESSVLGSILKDNNIMDEVVTILESNDFTIETHQILYQGMTHLYKTNSPIDIITVSEMLRKYGRLDQIGGKDYLRKLMASVPTTANTKFYAEFIKSRGTKNRALQASEKLKALSIQEWYDDEKFLAETDKLLETIRPKVSGNMKPLSETQQEYLDYIESTEDFINTGFEKFDKWMGGIGRGWLYVLAGRPSVGKTAKVLQMAKGIADQDKGQVLIWSQEMKRPQLLNRMISPLKDINYNTIRKKSFSQKEKEEILQGYKELSKLPLHIEDSTGVHIKEIRSTARQIQRKYGKIACIIVDYLTIMGIPQVKGETRSQAVGAVTREAKRIALELQCPFIMLAQMSREGAKDDKPKLHHLRDSGEIEQDADVVEFLWTNEKMQEGIDPTQGKIIESIIAKGRDVGIEEFKYVFKGWLQKYEEYDELGARIQRSVKSTS